MLRLLKRLTCRHKFAFVRNLYGDQIIEYGWKRSLWQCPRCGAVVARADLAGSGYED